MSLCFGGCGGYSDSLSLAACDILMLLLEVVLFQPILNFLRNDEVEDEGVEGSSGLDCVGVFRFSFVIL